MRITALAAAALLAAGCGKKDGDDGAKPGPAPTTQPPPTEPAQPETPPPPRTELAADPGGATGDHQWSRGFGGSGRDEPRAIALTDDGGVIVTGVFSGTVNFGPGELTAEALDVFVLKLDNDGKPVWAGLIGGGGEDIAADVAVDSKGNVVVVGWFSGAMKVGDTELKAAGGDDIFVVKLDKEGKPAWARQLGGDNTDVAWSVDIDPAGDDIVIAGEFRGRVNFGGGPLESKGNSDIFLLRLGEDGVHKWSKSFGDIGQDYGRTVAVDSRGDIVMAAEFSAEVDFGGGKPLVHKGNRDLVLAKYDKNGAYRWARGYGNTFDEVVIALALDPADNIVVGGAFEDRLELGTETLKSRGRSDAFVAKFTPDGEPTWAVGWGADRDDQVSGLGTDKFGNIVATGWFVSKVNFGGAELAAGNGNQDAFLVKLDHKGRHLWSQRFGDRDHDRGRALAVAPEGSITLAGIYRFTLAFNGNVLESSHEKGAKIAPADIFVARFAP